MTESIVALFDAYAAVTTTAIDATAGVTGHVERAGLLANLLRPLEQRGMTVTLDPREAFSFVYVAPSDEPDREQIVRVEDDCYIVMPLMPWGNNVLPLESCNQIHDSADTVVTYLVRFLAEQHGRLAAWGSPQHSPTAPR